MRKHVYGRKLTMLRELRENNCHLSLPSEDTVPAWNIVKTFPEEKDRICCQWTSPNTTASDTRDVVSQRNSGGSPVSWPWRHKTEPSCLSTEVYFGEESSWSNPMWYQYCFGYWKATKLDELKYYLTRKYYLNKVESNQVTRQPPNIWK